MFFQLGAVLLVLQIGQISSISLPPYISRCSLKDARLWECLTRNANAAIPIIVKGDKHYNIPPMCPLEVLSTIILKNDEDLQFVIHNPKIYGLENTLVSTMTFDGKRFSSVFINPAITIVTDYEIFGSILNKSIFGNGPANITLDKVVFRYNMTLPTRSNFGEVYFDMQNPGFEYESVQSIYNLENLFGGSKYLGEEMNKYINKNWEKVQLLFQPIATNVMRDVMNKIMSSIFNSIPVNEIFKA